MDWRSRFRLLELQLAEARYALWFVWDAQSKTLVPFVPENGKGPAGCDPARP